MISSWRTGPMYLQGILSCRPASCSQDSIRKGPDCQKEEETEEKYVWDDKKMTLRSIYFKSKEGGGDWELVECRLGDVFYTWFLIFSMWNQQLHQQNTMGGRDLSLSNVSQYCRE